MIYWIVVANVATVEYIKKMPRIECLRFAAHVTKKYLEVNPHLNITLDISHWVAVAESYLEDQVEAVSLAISRTRHIHSRVGYPEGPQIPDPRLPEWEEAVSRHLSWWNNVVEQYNGNEALTITTEFGPFPYLTHNYSQWDINVYMKEFLMKNLHSSSILFPQ